MFVKGEAALIPAQRREVTPFKAAQVFLAGFSSMRLEEILRLLQSTSLPGSVSQIHIGGV